MATMIKLKRSSVSGNIPTTGNLDLGELAINTYDGKMYFKKNDGFDSIVTVIDDSNTVTAGDGLSGGGGLGTNPTLNVDGTVVRTSGNQTIGDVKTFSNQIRLTSTTPRLIFKETDGNTGFNRFDIASSVDTLSFEVRDNANAFVGYAYRIFKSSNSVDSHRWFANSAERMRIDSTGNVGIGTSTPSELLEVNGTVKATSFIGNGSSLTNVNADTVDGLQATQFLRSDINDTMNGNLTVNGRISSIFFEYDRTKQLASGTDLNTVVTSGTLSVNDPVNGPGPGWWYLEVIKHDSIGNYLLQRATSLTQGTPKTYYRVNVNGTWGSWQFMWHSGNDGSGSGLDADKLDSLQSSQFLRSDVNDTMSGDLTVNGKVAFTHSVSGAATVKILRTINDGTDTPALIVTNDGENNDVIAEFRANASGTSVDTTDSPNSADARFRIYGNGDTIAAGNITATSFSGNGSSLTNVDADTVDGLQAFQFLRSDTNDIMNGHLTISSTGPQLFFNETDIGNTHRIVGSGGTLYLQAQDSDGTTDGNIRLTGYNNNSAKEIELKASDIYLNGNVGIGTDTPSETLDVNGNLSVTNLYTNNGSVYSSGTQAEFGRGSGSIGMSVNDGGGNCNITFNHMALTPDFSGSSARITSPVDSNVGKLDFQVGDNTVADTGINLTSILELSLSSIDMKRNVNVTGSMTATSFSGDGSSVTNVDADTVDGLQAWQFLRSDTGDVMSGLLDVQNLNLSFDNPRIRFDDNNTTNNGEITLDNTSLRIEVDEDNSQSSSQIAFRVDGNYVAIIDQTGFETDIISNRTGSQLVLNAGESEQYTLGNQKGENVYINAENGLQVTSSPDNWSSGWAGRQTAFINASDGSSSFPGDIKISESSPTIHFKDTTANAHSFFAHVNSNKFYILVDRDGNDSFEYPHPLKLDSGTNTGELFGSGILTVADEGSGNGLDADTVDGLQGWQFLRSDGNDSTTGSLTVGSKLSTDLFEYTRAGQIASGTDLDTVVTSGAFSVNGPVNGPGSGWWYLEIIRHVNSDNYVLQRATSLTQGTTKSYHRTRTAGTWGSWQLIWDSEVDGSGSGLDADKLDGLQSSQFLRSDVNDTMNGDLTVDGIEVTTNSISAKTDLILNDDAGIGANGSLNHIVGTGGYHRWWTGAADHKAGTNGNIRMTLLDNGNLGLGITNPSSQLHVVGNIRTDSGLLVDSSAGLRSVTGTYGTIETNGAGKNGWYGYSINGRAVFMHDNGSRTGIYNDVNNHWFIECRHGGKVELFYNNSVKLETTNSGIDTPKAVASNGNEYFGNHMVVNDTQTSETTQKSTIGGTLGSFSYEYSGNKLAGIGFANYNTSGTGWYTLTERFSVGIDFHVANGNSRSVKAWFNNLGHFYAPEVYNETSALGTNVRVQSNGKLLRSTSSIKYKKNVETILPEYSENIIYKSRPVNYQSKSENDNPDWSYWGFIAEELDLIDPRLVDYKENEDGSLTPEGVLYDRFTTHLVKVAQIQKEKIDVLEEKEAKSISRIEQLESTIDDLVKRIEALEA